MFLDPAMPQLCETDTICGTDLARLQPRSGKTNVETNIDDCRAHDLLTNAGNIDRHSRALSMHGTAIGVAPDQCEVADGMTDAHAHLHLPRVSTAQSAQGCRLSRCTGDGTRSFDALPRSHRFRLYRPSGTSRNRSNIHVYDVCPSRSRSMSVCHVPCPESCRP